MSTNREQIAIDVLNHAKAMYSEEYGWQVIVECMGVKGILEHLERMEDLHRKFPTLGFVKSFDTKEAIFEEFTKFARAHTERNSEVENEIF